MSSPWVKELEGRGYIGSDGTVLKQFQISVDGSSWNQFIPRFASADFLFGHNDYRNYITAVPWDRITITWMAS